jgi:SAM-dependent methyltransferase
LTALREGRGRFYPIEEAELGPVAGKRVLHLQCHFGSDTLKFAQRGANAVGLDFSADAIAAAQRLAGELGLADRADFVLADLYNAPAAIAEPAGFDIVFVSWGAICWVPDIRRWAEIVAHFLRPGGFLYLAEAHPAAMVFDDAARLPDGRPGFYVPYLAREAVVMEQTRDYIAEGQEELFPARRLRGREGWNSAPRSGSPECLGCAETGRSPDDGRSAQVDPKPSSGLLGPSSRYSRTL